MAAEFYYQRRMLFDTAKHLYDLSTMMEQDRIQTLHDIDVPIVQGNMKRIMTVQLSAWDILGIQYHAICNSNDYRNSITAYTVGQIVDLYHQFENQESPTEDLRKADLSGVFKMPFGMASEHYLFSIWDGYARTSAEITYISGIG